MRPEGFSYDIRIMIHITHIIICKKNDIRRSAHPCIIPVKPDSPFPEIQINNFMAVIIHNLNRVSVTLIAYNRIGLQIKFFRQCIIRLIYSRHKHLERFILPGK